MRQLASLVQSLGPGDEAARLYEETLPHCSPEALAAPFGNPKFQISNLKQIQNTKEETSNRETALTPCPSPGGRGESAARPLVSVIMPVYNAMGTIERAVRSVQAQTYHDWEAILVDDARCDGTWDLAERLAADDARFRRLRLAENSGPSVARNAGLRLARGEWIAYLDSDDEYHPDYLQELAGALDQGDVLMSCFDLAYDDGPPGDRARHWDPRRFRRSLFAFNPAPPMAVAHRRGLLESVGVASIKWTACPGVAIDA
jgi:cellulose synthase/poly-beta-1,6-N-acetylglucosamine synthase-like glycosyltransferase